MFTLIEKSAVQARQKEKEKASNSKEQLGKRKSVLSRVRKPSKLSQQE